jgi:hypothetical protein
MSCEEHDFGARKGFPSIYDTTQTIDKYVYSFNDITEGLRICSLPVILEDVAYFPCLEQLC